MFNSNMLLELLEDEKQKQELQGKIEVLTYEEYISERIDKLKYFMDNHKKIFLVAPTGGGKTKTVIELMHYYPDSLNVLLTPSVVQNKQNKGEYGREYQIQSFTGNDSIIRSNFISATYDKAELLTEYLKGRDIKLNLFIDEDHLMVEASNYRMKAIKSVAELTKRADKVVYMTATPNNVRDLLEHDIEIRFEPKVKKNNYSNAQVLYFDKKGAEATLVNHIYLYSKGDRKTILFLDDKEQLQTMKNILVKKGFTDDEVAIISSENRDSKAYQGIINNSLIDDETKVVLATSVLEVGTNINNTNVNVFVYIPKADRLNFNSIEQKIARLRKPGFNFLRICLVDREKEDNKIISFNSIERMLQEEAKENVNLINNSVDTAYKGQPLEVKNDFIDFFLNAPKSLNGVLDTLGMGVIDNVDCRAEINIYKLRRKARQLYDSQFYYDKERLKEELIKIVKTDLWLDDVLVDKNEDNAKEIQEVSQIKKETKQEQEEIIKNAFLELKENELQELFMEKLADVELDTKVCMIEEIYELIKDTKIPSIIKKGQKMNINVSDLIDSIIENGTSQAKNNKRFLEISYINWNKEFKLGNETSFDKILNKEYVYTRKLFDSVALKQGRVTNAKKKALLIQLIENNCIKGFEIKSGDIYKSNKKATQKQCDKILFEVIQSIYLLSSDNKGFKISSLK